MDVTPHGATIIDIILMVVTPWGVTIIKHYFFNGCLSWGQQTIFLVGGKFELILG